VADFGSDLQIGDHGLSYFWRQGEFQRIPTLPVADVQFASAPPAIFEAQTNDLSSAKTVHGKQQEEGVVALTFEVALVYRSQNLPDLPVLKISGFSLSPEDTGPVDGTREVFWNNPGEGQMSQEPSQVTGHRGDRPALIVTPLFGDEPLDVSDRYLIQAAIASFQQYKKTGCHSNVSTGALHPSLIEQMPLVLFQNTGVSEAIPRGPGIAGIGQ